MKNHCLAFLIYLCLFNVLQIRAVTFRHLDVKDGLSSRQVFQIKKDTTGFLWLFTSMGIDRYDGTEFRHYKLNEKIESKDHILSSSVMTCDNHGHLWVSLKNGEIYSYDHTKDEFILKINLSGYFPETVSLNYIFFDSDNRLWICLSRGLFLFDPELKDIQEIAGFSAINTTKILQYKDIFYVGTEIHLFRLCENRTQNTFSTPEKISTETGLVESLHFNKNHLYVGTFSNGAFVLELKSGNMTPLTGLIPRVPIRSIITAKENEIWFGTDGSGLYILDAENHRLKEKLTADEDEANHLSGNTISDILADENDCVWISTSTNGISIFDPKYNDIKWIRHEPKNQNSLHSNHVNIILEDSEGDLWYGTNNGVSLYRKKQMRWYHFLNNNTSDAKNPAVILALCEDSLKQIWAGGYGCGLFCINKSNGTIRKTEKSDETSQKGITTDYIFSLYADNESIWIGGIEGELTCYNIKNKTYTYFPETCVGDIKSGNMNKLLLATCNGLGSLDKKTASIQIISSFKDLNLKYPIRCLLQASSGDIWMATDGQGLICYNPEKNVSNLYTSGDIIKSNAINGIVEDALGRIWFTTEKELYVIEPSGNEVICMNEFLGVEWGYFNPNACLSMKNSHLAFGTAKGVIEFSPYFDMELKDSLSVLFTDFKLLYESVKVGSADSPIKQAINEIQSLSLKYEQNSFSISFSAINFIHPHQTEYLYQLDNFDPEWRVAPSTRRAEYMNLNPGNYTFRLKAINKYTKKTIGKRTILIHIDRPFWASWWAIACYLALLGILIYLLIQYVRNRIAKHDAKERIRFFIDVAHDIRTPISLIKAPLSEMETKEDLTGHGKELLDVAMKNADKLFTMVSQLLDLQKTDLTEEKLNIVQQDMNGYMHEKITSFRMAAVQKNIDLHLIMEEHFPEIWFDKGKMDKIMDNLLSNAIKYTEKGTVTVHVNHSGNSWSVKIEDSGIGIPANEQKHLFKEFYRAENAINSNESGSGIGLVLVHKLVRLMQGNITFSSKEKEGSSFIVNFPFKINNIQTKNSNKKTETPPNEKDEKTEPSEKEILLLAEDNKEMREYLKTSLSTDFNVIDVPDGEQMLGLAKELNPAIIISDVLMPKLRGDEACRILKSSIETSHIPFILLSALSEKEHVILGLEAGANDYIIKPFDFNILKARILNILNNREILRKKVLSAETGLDELNYTNQLDKEFLEKAIKIIEEELANPDFSINEFCKILGMSRTSVYNKIKTLTNQSPNDFIRIIRLNKAKELLKTKKYPVSEIAYMVGFSDPKYFSTSFKKQFGVSPSKSD
ncbi:MAG: helix-turn-helix domain-containing protein [Tannerella sp.]|jgi:signal transduction histidine kinase/ligand-binding sensor domain-containing protein/AraC-like DNA-binding protein/CheY-like chemotaxis protein|nr:helix-turn-helix domain-containing protein [Tannerella sp.]